MYRVNSAFVATDVLHQSKGEIQAFVNLDLDFLRSSGQGNPEPWGMSLPHNAYQELSSDLEKRIFGHETRLESGQLTADVIFHPSVALSPTDLKDPTFMFTLVDLQKKFGPTWRPVYSSLNNFEELCKKRWGKVVSALTSGSSLHCAISSVCRPTIPAMATTADSFQVQCLSLLENCLGIASRMGFDSEHHLLNETGNLHVITSVRQLCQTDIVKGYFEQTWMRTSHSPRLFLFVPEIQRSYDLQDTVERRSAKTLHERSCYLVLCTVTCFSYRSQLRRIGCSRCALIHSQRSCKLTRTSLRQGLTNSG